MALGSNSAPVVVIGLDCITGLQTARIFADKGVPVIGIARDLNHFSCHTRVCDKIIEGDTRTPALISLLTQLATELDSRAVLCPCTDNAVMVLSEHRAELPENYLLALPSADVVETLIDKEHLRDKMVR